MTSWKEIERVRKDRAAFQTVARGLLKAHSAELSPWEIGFLESVAALAEQDFVEQFTNRQGEKLLEIRNAYELIKTFRGFNIETLMRQCHEARADLSEADEEWIVALRVKDSTQCRRGKAAKLYGLARSLNIVETEFA